MPPLKVFITVLKHESAHMLDLQNQHVSVCQINQIIHRPFICSFVMVHGIPDITCHILPLLLTPYWTFRELHNYFIMTTKTYLQHGQVIIITRSIYEITFLIFPSIFSGDSDLQWANIDEKIPSFYQIFLMTYISIYISMTANLN